MNGETGPATITRMTLNSRESIIANIDVVIDYVKDTEHSLNFEKNQYYLNIQAVTATGNQETVSIKIPMISRNSNDFQDSM